VNVTLRQHGLARNSPAIVNSSRKRSQMGRCMLTGVPPDALGVCEETFGPVAYLNPFDTEEEAVAAANATPYGLAAYAFTRDLGRALRLGESLEAGMLAVNHGLPTASNAPFGGVKQSGWGRELGCEGLDAFLESRHVSLAFDAGLV